jgi:uracil-DNA glycosylase
MQKIKWRSCGDGKHENLLRHLTITVSPEVVMAKASKPRRSKPQQAAAPLIPSNPTLAILRKAASTCTACDLWERATHIVFGEGRPQAKVMFVGEQPGDREDLAGHPFVGPAGKLLDRALTEAGIARNDVYVTNVVKHFNWVPDQRGKKRIHKKPRNWEINACRPWLDAELTLIKPEVLVCLGATAAQALLGKGFSVVRHRGEFVNSPLAPHVMATVHPSSILRAINDESRHQQLQAFIEDLQKIVPVIRRIGNAA